MCLTPIRVGDNAVMMSGRERRNRVVALVLAAILLGTAVLALLSTVAHAAPAHAATTAGYGALVPAHARLVSVVPADGARLDTPPTQVLLTFDDTIGAALAQVVLTRGDQQVDTGAPVVSGTTVTTAVTDTEAGDYHLAWRVVSEDGHPVSGESSYTVVGAGAAAGSGGGPPPVPRVTPSYKTPQTQPTTFGHPDHLPGLFVAGILLLCGIALLVYEHRRRRAPDLDDGADDREQQPIS